MNYTETMSVAMKTVKMSLIVHFYISSSWNIFSMFYLFLLLCFFLFLQAVETNLASKDSHWVYVNEVRKSKEKTQLATLTHHHFFFICFDTPNRAYMQHFCFLNGTRLKFCGVIVCLSQLNWHRLHTRAQDKASNVPQSSWETYFYLPADTISLAIQEEENIAKEISNTGICGRSSPSTAVKACTLMPGEEIMLACLVHSNTYLHDTQTFSSTKLCWCVGQDPEQLKFKV